MGQMLCCRSQPEGNNKNSNESIELNNEEPSTHDISKKNEPPFPETSEEPPTASDSTPWWKRRRSSVRFSTQTFVSVSYKPIKELYDLKQEIGKGSYGIVTKCIHKQTGMERAVKTISRAKMGSIDYEEVIEVDVLKGLDHPNIIKIYNIIFSPRSCHIIMELVSGGDLHDYIEDFIKKQKELSEQDVARWMYNILRGVSYCHSKDVIHMDIKPDNIMFQDKEPDSILKIVDFGISIIKTKYQSKANGPIVYKAPEVFDGIFSAKADVWSCGVLLYWLLSRGDYPFFSNIDAIAINKIKNEDVTFPDKKWNWVTDGAKDLIRKMLTKDPDQRLTAKEAFDHEWVQGYSNIPKLDPAFLHETFGRLVKFESYLTIRHAALEYISSHFFVAKDLRKLQKAFLKIDTDHDGYITKNEMSKASKQLGLRKKTDIEELIEKLDTNGDRKIDFSEFITGAMNWENEMSTNKLEATFDNFDIDQNGVIDIDELKKVFGDNQMVDEETWASILSEADYDKDGKIQLDEFKEALTNIYLREDERLIQELKNNLLLPLI